MQSEGPARVQDGGRSSPERRGPRLAALVALAFLILQLLALPAVQMTNDGYRYARSTLQILGESRSEAQREALAVYCADQTAALRRARAVDTVRFREALPADLTATCVASMPNGLTPTSPRYDAIFDARLGYPLLAAPLAAVLGVKGGLYLTSLLCTALGGFLAYVLLRSAGARVAIALLGQVIYYATPIALWGSYPLAEGPTMALTMSALLGAWWMTRGRAASGGALLVTSLAMGFLVRYSSLLAVAGALAVAGLICLSLSRSTRHAGTYAMIAVNVAGIAGTVLAARALRWPGLGETLQDTFTRYFTHPDVTDPWGRLLELNANYWTQWLQTQLRAPWLLLVVGAAVCGLLRHDVVLGALVTAVAATGPVTVAAHPVILQDQRLMEALWVAPAVGVPILLASLFRPAQSASCEQATAPVSQT